MRVCLCVCLVRFCAKVQILSSWIFAFQFPHKASSSGGTLDDEFRAVCCEESPMCLMVSLLPFFYHEVFVGCRVDGWGFGEEGSSAVPGCRRIFWGQVGVGSLGRRGGGVRQGWLLDSTNSLSSSGRTRVEGGRPLPSPVACETLGRLVSGCWPSSTRSSTAGR